MPLIDALLKESSIEREQLQAVAVAAVSYTHLDVYKRQALNR